MNPATPSLMFSNPGMYDPYGKFAHISKSSVRQRQQGTTPQRTSPSNCSHCSSGQMQAFHQNRSIYHTICRKNTSLKVLTTSPGEMNLSEYMRERSSRQQTVGRDQKGRDQMNRSLMQKRKRNKAVVVTAAVVVVAVAARKYKKTGQGKETRRFCEPMEMKIGLRMMNATDEWRKRDRSNLISNNWLRTNNNPNQNSRKWKKIQKQMKTEQRGVQNEEIPLHSYNLTRTLKQTQTQTQITQAHCTIHLTNLHNTLNNTHHHPHQKRHKLYQMR
ncbi:MAG: hypothetical protein EZS28_052457, partial [Streblomastix strix]